MKDWVLKRAEISPRSKAFTDTETDQKLTYRELDQEVERLAEKFLNIGIESGKKIGILLDTSPKYIKTFYALMRIGAVSVPLNTRLSKSEINERVERADISLIICDDETKNIVPENIKYMSAKNNKKKYINSLQKNSVNHFSWSENDIFIIMFTSGTTGTPKPVTLSVKNIFFSAVSSAFRLGIPDKWYLCLPVYHMGGFSPIIRCTLYGSELIIQRNFDPERTVQLINKHKPSGISLVPVMLKEMLNNDGIPNSLDIILVGGNSISKSLVDRCKKDCIPIYPTYGLTETSSQVATAFPEEVFKYPETVGKPLMFTDVSIVNKNGEKAPKGEKGEIVVSGPTVTPGYYKESKCSFGKYGLHTGDIGYIDENNRLWVKGRISNKIITGGENVDPKEVSDVLCSHPKVKDCIIVGIEDSKWGEKVAALIVPEKNSFKKDEIKNYCAEKLANYKIPKVIKFSEDLPRTASGTVDRNKVKDILLS